MQRRLELCLDKEIRELVNWHLRQGCRVFNRLEDPVLRVQYTILVFYSLLLTFLGEPRRNEGQCVS
jgi:hypothetical protein